MTEKSHNVEDQLIELTHKYISCDERSAEINDERKEIRDKVIELGHDSKAFQDHISRMKADRKKKEGYDESYSVLSRIMDGLNKDDLFSWQDRREAAKQAERDEQKKKRDQEKSKADEYKAANERAPKDGKVIKGKSVGEQQAAAMLKAGHGNA